MFRAWREGEDMSKLMYDSIPLTAEIHKKAQDRADRIEKTHTYADGTHHPSTKNLRKSKLGVQHVIGALGQFANESYLLDHKVPHQHIVEINPSGQADIGDFIIAGKLIDIKTGQLPDDIEKIGPGYSFFIAKHQIPKVVDFYFHYQVSKDLDCAYLIGSISRPKALGYGPPRQIGRMVHPALIIPFDALMPVPVLLRNLGVWET